MISLTNTDSPTEKFELADVPAMIGRHRSAEVVVEDPLVGEFQCMLYQLGDTVRMFDLGGSTGTLVNGVRVKRGELLPGDTITIGKIAFRVQYDRRAASDSSLSQH